MSFSDFLLVMFASAIVFYIRDRNKNKKPIYGKAQDISEARKRIAVYDKMEYLFVHDIREYTEICNTISSELRGEIEQMIATRQPYKWSQYNNIGGTVHNVPNEKQTQAILNAPKQAKIQPFSNNIITFKVQGSGSDPYIITVSREERAIIANVTMHCTCTAARNKLHCKHRINLIKGDIRAIIDYNENDFVAFQEMLHMSDVSNAFANYEELEDAIKNAKKHAKQMKKDKSAMPEELQKTTDGITLAEDFFKKSKKSLAARFQD